MLRGNKETFILRKKSKSVYLFVTIFTIDDQIDLECVKWIGKVVDSTLNARTGTHDESRLQTDSVVMEEKEINNS